MNRFRGFIYLLFISVMVTTPLLVADGYFTPSQTTTPTFSGELIPDPYFSQEPYVEIGQFSQEFSYEYSPGHLAFIWMHNAGYELDYGDYYPATCNEYARVMQLFQSDYNESIKAVKLGASIRVDTTGDFAAADFPDNMWEITLGVYLGYSQFSPIRTITNFEFGEETDLEYMLSAVETDTLFYGPETMRNYGLYIQLTPTYFFGYTFGNTTPWMDYSGSVIASISHMSFEVMLEGESLAPPLTSPLYNTTLLENETTSVITGIESAGYNQLYEMRQEQDEMAYTLYTRYSDHQELRNHSILVAEDNALFYGVYHFVAQENRIATMSIEMNESDYLVRIECIDSFGNPIWNSTISLFYQDIPLLADFDDSGNLWIYILSVEMFQDPYIAYSMTLVHSLVKLDNQGNSLWNKTLRRTPYFAFATTGDLGISTGLGNEGDNMFIGFGNEIIKLNTNGEQIWNLMSDNEALCVDPQGGCYSYSRVHQLNSELKRWGTSGNLVWTKSLSWDYGSGWIEDPLLRTMTVGPNGPLHIVLEYPSVDPCIVLMRITRAGDIISQDKIFESYGLLYPYYDPYYFANLPAISDIAVTGDGLVHLVGTRTYSPYLFSPLLDMPGTFLITYQLSGIPAVSPLSVGMIGVASVLIIGIAYDYFFRRRNIPAPPSEPSIADFEW